MWPGQLSPLVHPIPPAPGHRSGEGEARAPGSGSGSPGCRQGQGGKLTKKPPSSLPQERRESLWQRQPCRQATPHPAGQPKLVRLEAATGCPGSPALLLPAVPVPAASDMASPGRQRTPVHPPSHRGPRGAEAGGSLGAEGQSSALALPPTRQAEDWQRGARAAPCHDVPTASVTTALCADIYTFVS